MEIKYLAYIKRFEIKTSLLKVIGRIIILLISNYRLT
jgi:hypothetical protein